MRPWTLLEPVSKKAGGHTLRHTLSRVSPEQRKRLKALVPMVAAGTVGGVIANQLPQNQKDSRTLVRKKP